VPVVLVDRFLAYLTDIGRSPNTVKAYAHDLKDFWGFIGFRGLDWREARLEDVGEFIAFCLAVHASIKVTGGGLGCRRSTPRVRPRYQCPSRW
jgi:site-specific recombinase XerD